MVVGGVKQNSWSDPDLVKTLIFMYSDDAGHLSGRDGS